MPVRRGIGLALDLARMPSLAGVLRQQPLPDDLLSVIQIAAACTEATEAASVQTRLPSEILKSAAALYLQQMLFFPDAGPFRNLGVSAGATKTQMRLHMRWLLQWLHPDHNPDETAHLLARRVIAAWCEISQNDPPRAEGVVLRQPPLVRPSGTHRSQMRVRWIAVPNEPRRRVVRAGHSAIVLSLAAMAVFALFFFPDNVLFGWFSGTALSEVPLASAASVK